LRLQWIKLQKHSNGVRGTTVCLQGEQRQRLQQQQQQYSSTLLHLLKLQKHISRVRATESSTVAAAAAAVQPVFNALLEVKLSPS
jgi:hypothetical protein